VVNTERQVPCPACSERCRNVDLGAWASEGYRVATQAPAEDSPDDQAPQH
jgi:uncharacterized protein